jgi:hypothetical protein
MEEMLTAHDIKKLWPDNPDFQLAVLLSQELCGVAKMCAGCSNFNKTMVTTPRDCRLMDKAHDIVSKIKALAD